MMQLVDGLCGLIPEAGGPICMAVTVPINTVTSQVMSELSSGSVKGFITQVEAFVLGLVESAGHSHATFVDQ